MHILTASRLRIELDPISLRFPLEKGEKPRARRNRCIVALAKLVRERLEARIPENGGNRLRFLRKPPGSCG